MRKCVVLNTLELTCRKSEILDDFISEYLHILDLTSLYLPLADSSTELHHLTYSNIRKASFLPSDIVQEARKDIWKMRKFIKEFSGSIDFERCSIRLNKRWFRVVKSERGNTCFKITYAHKKTFTIPIKLDRQFQRFNSFMQDGWTFDNVSILKDGRIAVVLEKEFSKTEINHRYVLGIDIGSSTLAAVSVFDIETSKVVRQLYFGRDVAIRQRRFILRKSYLKSLADSGSHKARQILEKLKRSQSNFVRTRSGQIAKEIVMLAKSYGARIAIERLRNIRGRKGIFNRKANGKISRIPYGLLIQFLKSNSEMFETSLIEVDAYHTSKWCSHCGAINGGHLSGNYALYRCKACGQIVNSDRKASLAVAVKSVLERSRTHELTIPSSIQISKTRVAVNGLLRSDDVGMKVAVQHNYQPMESLHHL